MAGDVEFGCFRDNEAALRTAKYSLERAIDQKGIDAVRSVLVGLRDHIRSTGEPKSTAILLPEILELLDNPRAHATVFRDTTADSEPPSDRNDSSNITIGASFSHEFPTLGLHGRWFEAALNSTLPQVALLCIHFLLVLSVLAFNVAISAFLSRYRVDIKSYVEPILHLTDVYLVALFCAESSILLTLTIIREVLDKSRSLWRDVSKNAVGRKEFRKFYNPALSAFRQATGEQIKFHEREIECGRFVRDAVEMPRAFANLGRTHNRFDAVSRDELPFWLEDPTNPLAEEYFISGADLVRKGKKVTRIFLLSKDQLEQGEILKQVLTRHLRHGIGVAIVPLDRLPDSLKECPRELDFGLWDRGSAYSVFRQREGGYARKMDIVFSCDKDISAAVRKFALYKEILPYAWLVDKVYGDCQRDLVTELSSRLLENNNLLLQRTSGRIGPEGNFYIEVNTEAELGEKINKLLALWTLTQGAGKLEVAKETEPVERTCNTV